MPREWHLPSQVRKVQGCSFFMELKITIRATVFLYIDDVVTGAMPVKMFDFLLGLTLGCCILHLCHYCSDTPFLVWKGRRIIKCLWYDSCVMTLFSLVCAVVQVAARLCWVGESMRLERLKPFFSNFMILSVRLCWFGLHSVSTRLVVAFKVSSRLLVALLGQGVV